jgi:hypothetical protein
MLKFSSKSDVNAECKCIVRLLDDSEVIECDIQVKKKKGCKRNSLPPPIPFFNRNNKKDSSSSSSKKWRENHRNIDPFLFLALDNLIDMRITKGRIDGILNFRVKWRLFGRGLHSSRDLCTE